MEKICVTLQAHFKHTGAPVMIGQQYAYDHVIAQSYLVYQVGMLMLLQRRLLE